MPVLILGGGLSGLAAGHYFLKAANKSIFIVEKSNALGGWLKTIQDPSTRILLEKGPHTIRARGVAAKNTLLLVEELGLASKIKAVSSDHPGAKNRLIYVNNRLHYLPTSLKSMFERKAPFSRPLVFSGYNFIFAPTKFCQDESMYSFAQRRFGNEVANYLIAPMICGICAGDAKKISVKFLLKDIFEAEQKYGSMWKAVWKTILFSKDEKIYNPNSDLLLKSEKEKWSVWGFKGGMKSFINALEENIKCKGGTILLDTSVNKMNFENGKVQYQIGDEKFESAHVISAISAKGLSPILKNSHPELADELASIPFVSVAVVNLVFERNILKHNAFGFLVPPSEKLPLLGVIFDSCIFGNEDETVLTVMIGGAWFSDHLGSQCSEEDILDVTLGHLKTILGIEGKPISYHVSVLKDCIPQYVVGHVARVNRIKNYIKANNLPLSLVGSSYNGVGINDVIMSAKEAVNNIVK